MSGIGGKVVAITGASSGIGEAAARLLAERGATVVLGARGAERLDAVAADLARTGASVAHRVTDVRRRADVEALVALACDRFGRIDVMINNAGASLISPLDDLRVDEWDEMIDVNIKGVLYGIAAALPHFRRQGSGHFVTTASTAGHRIVPSQGVYAGTKNAVRAICEALRQEAGDKLRVTVISPGFVRTNLADAIGNPETKAQIVASMERFAIPADAIARGMAFAIEQPPEVDVGEIIIRPTAQA